MGENNRLARKQKTDGGVEGKGIQRLTILKISCIVLRSFRLGQSQVILKSISSMFSGFQGADQNAKDEGLSEESKGKLSL